MAIPRNEADLEAELERLYQKGGTLGYWAKRFHQRFTPGGPLYKGGVAAVRTELMKTHTAGLEVLKQHKRLDLSLERLVLNRKWKHLFTDAERVIAKLKLNAASK
jgi:hypothetical protein